MEEHIYKIHLIGAILYLLFFCTSAVASAQLPCTSSTKNINTEGSCNFQADFCGWSNRNRNGPLWVFGNEWDQNENWFINSFAVVTMSGYNSGTTALLESPWLCPTAAYQHTLNFRFSMQDDGQCQLSVYISTDDMFYQRQGIWNTTRSAESGLNYVPKPLLIPVQDRRFQIIFEARQLTYVRWWREPECSFIRLDDIFYNKLPLALTTNTPTLSPTISGTSSHHSSQVITNVGSSEPGSRSTAEAPTYSTRPTNGEEPTPVAQRGSEGSFGTGAVIGIIIGIIAAIAIVVFIVFFLRRLHRNSIQKCPSLFTHCRKVATQAKHTSQAVDNAVYSSNMLDLSVSTVPKVATTGNGVPPYELASVLQRIEGSPYEVIIGPSAALYSKPMMSKTDPNGTVLHAEDDYNKLSHKAPVRQHTKSSYDHLDHQDTKMEPGQLTSTSEYSPSRTDNENSVIPISVAREGHVTVTSKSNDRQNYVNVSPGVKTPLQTTDAEYSRLDLDHPQKAKATGVEKTGGHEVYRHLYDEDSEYRQLDFDHDHPQNAREHEDDTDGQDMYHHLQADAQGT